MPGPSCKEAREYETNSKILGGGAILIALIAGVVVGCQLFEKPHSTEVTAPVTDTAALNYIVLPGRIAEWQAFYVPGDGEFSVNSPVAGVLRIRYYLEGGGCFALYLSAMAPPLVEVGLMANEDGTYPIVANVSVDYLENGTFTGLPANAALDEQPTYTKYLRQEADGNLMDWWPCDEAGFGWSGNFSVKDALLDEALAEGVAEGTLAPRPVPVVAPSAPPVFACVTAGGVEYGGLCWVLGAAGQSCDAACAGVGGSCDLVGTTAYGSGGTEADCGLLLQALGRGAGAASGIDPSANGCFWYIPLGSGWRGSFATTCSAATLPGAERACACQ